MKVLIFGSRSLTWKHYEVFWPLAWHASLAQEHPLAAFMEGVTQPGGSGMDLTITTEPLALINGDGPPGKERGAIGADKLALFACMQKWEPAQRRIRWFPPEPKGDETWAQAAGRRNREMVEAKPDRAYCVHTDLDSSKGSNMTASLLTSAGIPFWYVRVTSAGALVSVEKR